MAPFHRWLQPRDSVSNNNRIDWLPPFIAISCIAVLAIFSGAFIAYRSRNHRQERDAALRKRDSAVRKRDAAFQERDTLQAHTRYWHQEWEARTNAENLLASSVREKKDLTKEIDMLWEDIADLEKEIARLKQSRQAELISPKNLHISPSRPRTMPAEAYAAHSEASSPNVRETAGPFPPPPTRWSPVPRRVDSNASSGAWDSPTPFPGHEDSSFRNRARKAVARRTPDLYELKVVEARRLVGQAEDSQGRLASPRQAEIDETTPVEEAAHQGPEDQRGREERAR